MIYHTHRSRLLCAVAVGLLTIALLSQTVDASQAASLSDDQREASIKSLLEFCAGPTYLQQPIAVTFSEERKPWAQRSEIEAELSRFSNRPDHPKRVDLEFQLSMFDQPERELFYCISPDGDWIFKSYGVRYAQSGNLRWISSKPEGGQLSVMKAGVPYPSGFEVGRFKPVLLSHHRRLFYAGFSEQISKLNINELSVSAATWSAEVSVSNGDHTEIAIIEGKWADLKPIVSSVRSESGEPTRLFEQNDFDSHESDSSLSPFPFATSCRSDDYSSSSSVLFVVTAVESLSKDEVASLVSVPDLESATAVRDFRDPQSPSFKLYADAALTTWSKENGTDEYETSRLESANMYTEESVATVRRRFLWAAIALVATVLIGGLVLRVRSR